VYAGRNMIIRGNPAANGAFSASPLQRAKSIRLCPLWVRPHNEKSCLRGPAWRNAHELDRVVYGNAAKILSDDPGYVLRQSMPGPDLRAALRMPSSPRRVDGDNITWELLNPSENET